MKSRPAETTGGLAGVACALAALLGADETTIAVVGTLAGLLPAAVTLLVAYGGVRGVLRALWRGRSGQAGVTVVEALLVVFLAVVVVLNRLL